MKRLHLYAVCLVLTTACGQEDTRSALPPATGPGAPPRPELPDVAADAVRPDVAEVTSQTTGTTHPRARAEVAPSMSGVIAKISVVEGARVKKGQVLFQLRTTDLELRVAQANTALKSAEIHLASVKVEHDRMQRLFEKNAIDSASWDRTRAQYEAAQVGVEQANVQVSLARQMFADASVRSPIDGVVTAKLKNVGEMATMMPPSIVVIVEDHSTLELRFRLPERALRSLAPDDTIRAEFGALGVTREAKVVRVSPNVDPRTRTFEVVSEIANGDGTLKAGMLATIQVIGPAAREDRP
jgi:RND family efflux transporter MFP subunit